MRKTKSESWVVYKHTFPNGKVYYGITNKNTEQRWGKNGIGYKDQPKMLSAIMKYGWQNVRHEILKSELSKSDAMAYEQKCIESEHKGATYNTAHSRSQEPVVTGGESVYSIIGEIPKKTAEFFKEKYGWHLFHIDLTEKCAIAELLVFFDGEKAVTCKAIMDYPEDGLRRSHLKEWLETKTNWNICNKEGLL